MIVRFRHLSSAKPGRVLDTLFPAPISQFIPLVCLLSVLSIATTGKAATFGERQISAFTKSRPGTEEILREGQEVYKFLKKAFAGIYTSVPLAWDSAKPNDNAYAEHKPSVDRKFIKLRVSPILSPPDQVACLVYEAINAQNEKQFTEITEEAHQGLISKTEFIHNILRLEHKSLKKTRAFLSKQEPYIKIDISKTIFYNKMYGTPEEFDDFLEYLNRIKRKEYDVFKHYSDFYDFIIPPTKRLNLQQKQTASGADTIKTPAMSETE